MLLKRLSVLFDTPDIIMYFAPPRVKKDYFSSRMYIISALKRLKIIENCTGLNKIKQDVARTAYI
jgi:hypothetical protein